MGKIKRYLAAFVILYLVFNSASWAGGYPLSLSIGIPYDTFKSGEKILLQMALKNVSSNRITKTLDKRLRNGELAYKIEITGPDGKPAILTDYGLLVYGEHSAINGSSSDFVIDPNNEIHSQARLDRIFVMTAPGTYFVMASGYAYGVMMISNVVEIKVEK